MNKDIIEDEVALCCSYTCQQRLKVENPVCTISVDATLVLNPLDIGHSSTKPWTQHQSSPVQRHL